MRAIAECLARGRQAIVMVPEISLTPADAGAFRGAVSRAV
jgi:primosomal protein N'